MPLLWLSAAFLLGIYLASHPAFSAAGWMALALAAGVIGILEIRLPALAAWRIRRRHLPPLPVGFLLATLLLGSARYQASRPVIDRDNLAFYNGLGQVHFTALVVDPPRRLDHSVQLKLRSEELLEIDGTALSRSIDGPVLAMLPAGSNFQYGDRLEVSGRLEDPPDGTNFSYRDYLARQGVHSTIHYPRILLVERNAANPFIAVVQSFRGRAYRVLNRLFPQPEASLLAGILLGMDDDIPSELVRAFRDTGTAHIIAISGFNIAILAALFSSIMRRFIPDRWLSLLASVTGITLYTIFVGAGASVVRAAIMGSLSLLSCQIGRRNSGLNALTFSGAVMCAFNPDLLWDLSFQLSFSATLGLVLFGVPLENWINHWMAERFKSKLASHIAGPFNEYCLLTLTAQITTFPVLIYHFQRLSVSSILANPLVLPPQPFVMILGGFCVLTGMLLFPLGEALSFLVWPFLNYTIRVTEALAGFHGSAIVIGQANLFWIFIYFLVVFFIFRNLPFIWQQRSKIKPVLRLSLLGLGSLILWRGYYQTADGLLHLFVIWNSPNPSVQVQTSGGRFLLIENGSPTDALSSAVARRLPLSNQRLDGLLLPGHAAKNLAGLPEFLDRFPAGWILWNASASGSQAASRLQDWAQEEQIPMLPMETGLSIDLGDSARIEVLSPGCDTNYLNLTWREFRVIITGGNCPADPDVLPQFESWPGAVWILSDVDLAVNPPTDWLSRDPGLVIAPSGATGLPSRWLSLDRHGSVEITTDGQRMWVYSER